MQCLFHWAIASDHEPREDRRVTLHYTKTIELPFFPREGDDFELAECFACTVTSSWFYPDQNLAAANVEEFQIHHGEALDWLDWHQHMLRHGWAFDSLEAWDAAEAWFRETWMPQIQAAESANGGDNAAAVESLGLSVRAENCLHRAGIDTVAQLCQQTVVALGRIPHMGGTTVAEIVEALAQRRLRLREFQA